MYISRAVDALYGVFWKHSENRKMIETELKKVLNVLNMQIDDWVGLVTATDEYALDNDIFVDENTLQAEHATRFVKLEKSVKCLLLPF